MMATNQQLPEGSNPSDRHVLKRWLIEVYRQLGRSVQHFAVVTGMDVDWLSLAIDETHPCCPSSDVMVRVSRALRLPVPFDVRNAADRVTRAARPPVPPPTPPARPKHAAAALKRIPVAAIKPTGPDLSPLGECNDATAEARELLMRVTKTGSGAERNLELLAQRLGVGYPEPATLEAVGDVHGITRERVRQVEARALATLETTFSGIATPQLDQLIAEFRLAAGVSLAIFERQFAGLVGESSAEALLRFAGRIKRIELLPEIVLTDVGRGRTVELIGTADDARELAALGFLARKLQRFGGAVSVDALRRLLENELGYALPLSRVLEHIELIGDHTWLDAGKLWFWMRREPMSPRLQQAAAVMRFAQRPVSVELVYAGVLRETKTVPREDLLHCGYAIPPYDVFARLLLDHHPDFKRCAASTIDYVGRFNARETLCDPKRLILAELERRRGVATRHELVHAEGLTEKASRWAAGMMLYDAAWIERLTTGVYAIRGRLLDPSDVAAAAERAIAHMRRRLSERSERRATTREAAPRTIVDRRPIAEDGCWTNRVVITPEFATYGVVTIPPREVPQSMSGNYRLPDGHRVALIAAGGEARIVQVGEALRTLLTNVGCSLVMHFDGVARTLTPTLEKREWDK